MNLRVGTRSLGNIFAVPGLLGGLTVAGLAAAFARGGRPVELFAWLALGTPLVVVCLYIARATRRATSRKPRGGRSQS